MGVAIDDDDFNEEIQDIGSVQPYTHGIDDHIFSIQTSKGSEWLDLRRHVQNIFKHHECCFGINYWHY
jgi:hypothetical protein